MESFSPATLVWKNGYGVCAGYHAGCRNGREVEFAAPSKRMMPASKAASRCFRWLFLLLFVVAGDGWCNSPTIDSVWSDVVIPEIQISADSSDDCLKTFVEAANAASDSIAVLALSRSNAHVELHEKGQTAKALIDTLCQKLRWKWRYTEHAVVVGTEEDLRAFNRRWTDRWPDPGKVHEPQEVQRLLALIILPKVELVNTPLRDAAGIFEKQINSLSPSGAVVSIQAVEQGEKRVTLYGQIAAYQALALTATAAGSTSRKAFEIRLVSEK